MLYGTLRAIARVALHWYYSDVIVQGRERIALRGPLLVVANHPNALVDALLVATVFDRRVLLTAKATLFDHPLFAPFLAAVGVVPLRRTKDERTKTRDGMSPDRNTDAFRLVTDALCRGQVVLVFPEGISHDEPSMAPLKTGAARMALQAHAAGTRGLQILPVGLVFEEKERPRSCVLVRIGDPIDVASHVASSSLTDAASLTREVEARLRQVTLNFASAERAGLAVRVARALAAIIIEPPNLGHAEPFAEEAVLAARVEAATEALDRSPALIPAAESLIARLELLETGLAPRGVNLADVRISLRLHHGAWFAVREGGLALVTLPVAALGRLTHWLPIRVARALAMRSLAGDPSRDQPAMRTIVIGVCVVLIWYGLQAALVTSLFNTVAALLWLIVIFVAARVDLLLGDRLSRAHRRARTYLVLRADKALRLRALTEIEALLGEAIALEHDLLRAPGLAAL